MSKRRLLYYSDSRHYYMYCYDPPMRLQDARAPVDEVAGTSVDTFVYGSGAGTTLLHDTKVGEVWGRRSQRFESAWAWRAYENVRSLIDRGMDPLNVLIERAHDTGMEFFASMRTAHQVDPKDVDNAFNWQFRIDHPEWCLTGPGKHAFNWVHPEVRAERFSLIEETVDRYDVDGFEVDWVYWPSFFEEGEVERNAYILTQFMRHARGAADQAAQRRGRPIALGARVLPTLAGNLAVGLDVPTWVNDGILDFVVPTVYLDRQMDADFPFEWLVELARGTACEVYPALQPKTRGLDISDTRIEEPLDYHGTLDHYRAGAAAYWSKGADAIYLPWLKWPPGAEQRQVLSEIHDPDLLREKRKRYVVRRHDEDSASHRYAAHLKVKMTTGLAAPGHIVPLFVADELDVADARLKVRLTGSTALDALTVSLNGTALPPETCKRTEQDGYYGAWLEYHLARGVLRNGRNEVGVALHSRAWNLTVPVFLESVELDVDYPSPRPDTRDRP